MCEISRKHVVLDETIFAELVRAGVTARYSMSELFSGIRLYLEDSGDIVAEFLPDRGSLHYVTFPVELWEPADGAPAYIVKAHNDAVQRSEKRALVFDIFSGAMLSGRKREKNLGDMLRAAVDDF
ncbi:hypothetical protein LF599_07640 [Pseudodesulfovibrio thermohalotolerans]|uniref:hypothetical protein n=1 Tax=Pseudodesulfovibrio thermohalotolerans TaxID=2880651 RepID=UPI002443518A|nr:hypothetical protein [Pseudodesulfovibrio thermohalotolerans]WFS64027.1 hypothetical protein LF599_07640 [Pseudodesulfovibrio thermohalotolerans]